MSWFFKEARFSENFDDVTETDPSTNAHALHEDFDQMDEMMMHGGDKTPTFRQMTSPVKMLCVKKANKIDGLKINWGTPFSPNFTLTHAWNFIPPNHKPPNRRKTMMNPMMADQKQSVYSLQAQYAHVNEKNPQEADFIVFANVESNGRVQSVFGKNLNSWIHCRLTSFFPNSDFNMSVNQFEVDIEGKQCKHNISLDAQATSYSIVQTLNKNLFLGFEIFYAFERRLCDLNYCAKYVHKKNNFFFEYSSPMKTWALSYLLRLSPKVTLGTELT